MLFAWPLVLRAEITEVDTGVSASAEIGPVHLNTNTLIVLIESLKKLEHTFNVRSRARLLGKLSSARLCVHRAGAWRD